MIILHVMNVTFRNLKKNMVHALIEVFVDFPLHYQLY